MAAYTLPIAFDLQALVAPNQQEQHLHSQQQQPHQQQRPASLASYEQQKYKLASRQPLNYTNLSSHTTALQQQVPSRAPIGLLRPPTTCCKKRSRSSSTSSPSSQSSPSSHASVFSFENEHLADSGYESQTSLELSPLSRKSSSGEDQQQLNALSSWRASISELDAAHVCKKLKATQGAPVAIALPPPSLPPVPADSRVEFAISQLSVGAGDAHVAHMLSSAVSSDGSCSGATSASASSVPCSEGKVTFVDNLVDAAVRTLDAIWNASVTGSSTSCDLGEKQTGLPLQIFVRETLRRGRTSCSTLQAALLYCVRLQDAIEKCKTPQAAGSLTSAEGYTQLRENAKVINCPRRMFLAAVMVSSKFVQDRTYSNRAWSKISGLPVKELGKIERAFLAAIDYRLVVAETEWEDWVAKLMKPSVTMDTAAVSDALAGSSRRSSLNRSASDNVTGAALPLDTELRAASPQVPSQVQPKYRSLYPEAGVDDIPQDPTSSSISVDLVCATPGLPLPYPMQLAVRASQV